MPGTWAITCAVATKRSVMMAVALVPTCSASITSCILHDEQLPQSLTTEMTALQPCIAASTGAGAGRRARSLALDYGDMRAGGVRTGCMSVFEAICHPFNQVGGYAPILR
jgi:hypothetical protein